MKKNYIDIFKSILIYSPTLILLPQSIMYLIISAIGGIYFLSDLRKNNLYKSDLIFFVFVVLSLVVYFLLGPVSQTESLSLNDYVPYTVFLLTTIFFSRHLNNKILFYILCFICFEILVGVVQYAIGRPYIIKPAISGETEFGESELLYFNRVFGLSSGVSIFGYKILVGIILLFYLKIKKYRLLILGWLFVGLFITFNRTSMVGSILFLIIYIIVNLKSFKLSYKISLIFGCGIILYYINLNLDSILNQFFRGREGDLSGRENIFPYFAYFIENNWLLGNNFHKMWGIVNGRNYHAHNSYLQTLANMGVIFFSLLWVYIFAFFKKSNIIYIIPILVYSSFQYGILWGVSFLDIIFFYILFNKSIPKKNENTTSTSIFPRRR